MAAVGFYSQSVSDHNGIWQGATLDTSWDPWKNGKFIGSLISTDRPTGSGVVGSIGKYQEFRGGYGFLGLATSKGADFLPTFQLVTDLNLELPIPGLVLGGGYIYTRVRDHHENMLASIGPTLYAGEFISTVRVSLNRSQPGNHDSSSMSVQLRHGAQDYRAWQSFHVSWGGEAYQNLIVREAVEARGIGAGMDCFFPFGQGWNLQMGMEWGQKNSAYRLWGGSIRIGRMFPSLK
jgi:YaiO family outer membrane protein